MKRIAGLVGVFIFAVICIVGVVHNRFEVRANSFNNNKYLVKTAKRTLLTNDKDNPFVIEYGANYDVSILTSNIQGGFPNIDIEVYVDGEHTTIINGKKVGLHTVEIQYSKEDKFGQVSRETTTLYYEVKDTQVPIIKVFDEDVETIVDVESDFDPRNLVLYAADPVDGILKYSENLEKGAYIVSSDYVKGKAGTYTVIVEAMDNNGLTTKIEHTIKVVNHAEEKISDQSLDNIDENRVYIGNYTAVLYFGNSQAVTDAVDSANYYPVSQGVTAIADHNYQGIYNAMLNNDTGYVFGKPIHKVATYYGHVDGTMSDINFYDGGSYQVSTDGPICMYTCTDNSGGRLVTYWDYD